MHCLVDDWAQWCFLSLGQETIFPWSSVPCVSSYCLTSRGWWVSVFYRNRIIKQHPCMTPNLFLAQHYVFIDTGKSSCRTIYLFLISLSLPLLPIYPYTTKLIIFYSKKYSYLLCCCCCLHSYIYICRQTCYLMYFTAWVTQKLQETNSPDFIHPFTLVNRMWSKNTFSPQSGCV